MSLGALLESLAGPLRGLDGIRVETDIGASVTPPTGGAVVVLSPPALTFDGYQPDPTGATVLAALVVRAGDRAMPRLFEHLPRVTAVIHNETDAVVVRADPGTWPAGTGSDLPAYLIEIEVSL